MVNLILIMCMVSLLSVMFLIYVVIELKKQINSEIIESKKHKEMIKNLAGIVQGLMERVVFDNKDFKSSFSNLNENLSILDKNIDRLNDLQSDGKELIISTINNGNEEVIEKISNEMEKIASFEELK